MELIKIREFCCHEFPEGYSESFEIYLSSKEELLQIVLKLFRILLFLINQNVVTLQPLKLPARVAELVDAADSKSAAFTGVLVRFQSRAPDWKALNFQSFPFFYSF